MNKDNIGKGENISPFIMVIFGGSGDLTLKKVISSIFELFIRDMLPNQFHIYSFARSDYNTTTYKQKIKSELEIRINNKLSLLSQLSDKDDSLNNDNEDETKISTSGTKIKNIDLNNLESENIKRYIGEVNENKNNSEKDFISHISSTLKKIFFRPKPDLRGR